MCPCQVCHVPVNVLSSLLFLGGRGEDSSVIVTLPECSAFSDIPEEALAKVFTYLTLIPRYVFFTVQGFLFSAVHQTPAELAFTQLSVTNALPMSWGPHLTLDTFTWIWSHTSLLQLNAAQCLLSRGQNKYLTCYWIHSFTNHWNKITAGILFDLYRKRQPGVKFIIILDRRLDTWASIKTALARIAVSFFLYHQGLLYLINTDTMCPIVTCENTVVVIKVPIGNVLWAVCGAENKPLRATHVLLIRVRFGTTRRDVPSLLLQTRDSAEAAGGDAQSRGERGGEGRESLQCVSSSRLRRYLAGSAIGNLKMAGNIKADCFYWRGMPKIRRSPVMSCISLCRCGV